MRVLHYSSADPREILAALARPTRDWSAYREKVRPIIGAVRREGDAALRWFTKQFDGVDVAAVAVPREYLQQALDSLPSDLRASLELAQENITRFHQVCRVRPRRTDGLPCVPGASRTHPTSKFEAPEGDSPILANTSIGTVPIETLPGVCCWREVRPIPSAGLYVPGGSAPLVSTVLMLGIPARLAGVGRVVLCTPPGKDGRVAMPVLAACAMVGVEEVFAVGGAQAIAAMAYGTESVPKVAKIAGPGNIYVSAAKAEVSVDPDGAAIDMLAGPSELMVIADNSADPALLAADLLSQAEHDSLAQIVLIVTDQALLSAVQEEVVRQIASLPRRETATAALKGSVAILIESLDDAAVLANHYAPEHLSIQTQQPERVLSRVCNAGSVFLGPYSPEAAGDYCSGTNHVLPTSGVARVQGGVSVATFQKQMTVQRLTADGLRSIADATTTLARAEGLEAHARAVESRFAQKP